MAEARVPAVEPPYNPLDKRNLGTSVADALLQRAVQPLTSLSPFVGAGIYAIYYIGDYEPYSKLSKENRNGLFRAPIYVGKAIPKGARKGGSGFDAASGQALFQRLGKHAASVSVAEGLKVENFFFRYLVVEDIFIPLGESLLIDMLAPLWNVVLTGFGNNDPGSRRKDQFRSPWDVVHSGRTWAAKLGNPPHSRDYYVKQIEKHLSQLNNIRR